MIGSCEALSSLSGILAGLLGEIANLAPRFGEALRRVEVGEPAVAGDRGALEHAIDIAADQDGGRGC